MKFKRKKYNYWSTTSADYESDVFSVLSLTENTGVNCNRVA